MRGYVNPVEDYVFAGYAGIDNCDYCDNFATVNEWNRPDGSVVFVCTRCEINKRFPEKP